MKKIRVYLDTDTIIAAIIQPRGTTANLLKNTHLIKYLSNTSRAEIKEVVHRKQLSLTIAMEIMAQCRSVIIQQSDYTDSRKYVSDPGDMHIITSTRKTKSLFLITYNLKHFKINQIHKELDIVVFSPAQLIQYLSSKT